MEKRVENNLYTGYVDSEREPIKVDDLMASESECFVGMVIQSKQGLILSYEDGTYDCLKDVANKYHIITEEYLQYLEDKKWN